MVMRDICSFHCPDPDLISRGNKYTACIPKKTTL